MGLLLALLLLTPPQSAGVAETAAGRLLVLDKSAAAVEIVDIASGEVRRTLKVGEGPHEVAIAPDGLTAAVADYGSREPGRTITLIDLGAQVVVRTLDLGAPARPHGLVWESDGRHLWVTAEVSGELLRVDAAATNGAPVVVARVDVGKGTAGHMVAKRDDDMLFVSHIASGSVTQVETIVEILVDAGGGAEDVGYEASTIVASGQGAEGIAVRPGGKELWVTNRADGTVCVFELGTAGLAAEPAKRLPCPGFPIRVVFTPDGGTAIVSCAEAGEIELFACEERISLGRIAMPLPDGAEADASTDPIGVTTNGDGTMAYVSLSAADCIAEIDLGAQKVLRLIPVGRVPDGIAWYPLPRRLTAPPPPGPPR